MKPYSLIFLLLFYSCSKNNTEQIKQISNQTSFFEKAWEFKDKGDTDNAVANFYKAKDAFLQEKDSAGAGKSLVNIAIILTEKGDYFGAQETSLAASNFFNSQKKSNYEYIKSNYNNLGIASYNLKDFQNSLKFYDLAIKFSNDALDTRIYLNNKAKTLQATKNYKEALKIYNQIFKEVSKNKKEYSRTLTNLAKTKWLEDPKYNPVPELTQALDIRLREKDLWGLNSSYAHLSDYYIKEEKYDFALTFAKKMYEVAKLIKSPDDQIEALQKLVISESPQNSKKYFLLYQKLNDSIYISRSKAKNQFAVIRYDVEKNKAENELLKANTAEQQNQILKQYFLVACLVLALIIIIIWYRRRQIRLKQENELKIKNNQLKLSKKVHDVVANGIYQVMAKIENQENIDKNEMLDELEFVYEKSRDISYEKIDSKEDEEDFSKKISQLVASFKNESINTYVAGNDETIWKDFKVSSQDEVYQIIRELLVNMKKHSQADRVVFKFERVNNFITISYTDNGIGISGELIYKNGLTSTVSRIENIHGEIIFDTEIEKGLKITISFPI
ncbi:tetratricopeptide repeat-containing sensor histidine kinase [Chryseobacterium polytrichastri]|uniref:Signal transduction histidine kinase n=1 Tax=Chryseobacterium polytrichastri TaxID=1302687 RepID=A0A1M6ZB10_9FLAO|nr:tetratricopeptide repeat-containing sensor histidine kinase [Chryseobacterium polytrichastri]SHL27617.1 Signal transduction histidine kinase [Chryseobacterium polytrichastri]